MFDSDTAVFAANKAKRELAQEGRIGRTETRKPITYNGGADRVDVMGLMCAKVSDVPVDLNTVSRVDGVNLAGITVSAEKDSLTLVNEEGIYYLVMSDHAVVFSFHADNIAGIPSGMYIADSLDNEDVYLAFRVTSVEFAETIHPIDPKYLPEVPVLDINEALGGALVVPYQEHSATNVDLSAYIPALMKGELRIKLKMMLSSTSSADFSVFAHPLEIVSSELPIPVYVVCLNAEVNGTILMLQVRLIPANGVGTVEVNSWALATK